MGKVSSADKMRTQALREQGYGAKAIMAAYPQSLWKLSTVKKICKRVAQRGSATERKAGSGQPRSARSSQTSRELRNSLVPKKNRAART